MILQVFYRADVVRPGIKEAHAIVHAAESERLVISGLIGIRPEGMLETGMRAQMERAWLNLLDTVEAAGFDRQHILRITAYVTEPGRILLFREITDRMLDGHTCPCAYRQVSALAAPSILFELEAEAVKSMVAQKDPGQSHASDNERIRDAIQSIAVAETAKPAE